MKISMVYDAVIVITIVDCIKKEKPEGIVTGRAMIPTSGRRLMTEETI